MRIADPCWDVQIGLVTNMRWPGGNVTGVRQLNAELGPQRLQLADELMPTSAKSLSLTTQATPHAPKG
jgi:hypothetical protein